MIIFKGCRVLSFAENMSKIIDKNTIKNLSGKYCQKRLDHIKQSGTDALKTPSKK